MNLSQVEQLIKEKKFQDIDLILKSLPKYNSKLSEMVEIAAKSKIIKDKLYEWYKFVDRITIDLSKANEKERKEMLDRIRG